MEPEPETVHTQQHASGAATAAQVSSVQSVASTSGDEQALFSPSLPFATRMANSLPRCFAPEQPLAGTHESQDAGPCAAIVCPSSDSDSLSSEVFSSSAAAAGPGLGTLGQASESESDWSSEVSRRHLVFVACTVFLPRLKHTRTCHKY